MRPVERNELLTRVGRGTPIGELFRRYWLPVLLGEELPEPDCAPVRVKLLGERLIAFRDTQGRIGLIEEFCAHRGVSLWFGRNEENGIRCPYHGWKYDVTGQCVDLPSEPDESGMRKNIKLKSYPAIERAGVIWAYLGPADKKPEEPAYEWTQVPPAHRYVSKRLQETNYMQAMEGALDSIHSGFLHRHSVVPIDDEHCWTFSVDYHPARALTAAEREAAHGGRGIHVPLIEGSFIPIANRRNDYLIDRTAQKAKKSFSGVPGVGVQDAAVQESMGAIQDRSREHLVSSDNGIVKTRKRLMDAAKAVGRGLAPPGLDPAAQGARAVAMVVPRELSLSDAVAMAQKDPAKTVPAA